MLLRDEVGILVQKVLGRDLVYLTFGLHTANSFRSTHGSSNAEATATVCDLDV